MSRNRIFRVISLVIMFIMAFFVIVAELLIKNAYQPAERAMIAMENEQSVEVWDTLDYIVFESRNASNGKGIIFYPGGSVNEESYTPLMCALAEEGFVCVVARMPFYLAVFDINAADKVIEEVDTDLDWYMAGHSLGGAMAATYAEENAEKIEGVILLAAYSTRDLKDDNLDVLSVYGSADGVLNMENYTKYESNLPQDFREVVLMGGNHANFGDYGPQEGDGTAEISAESQQKRTVQAICDFIK